MCGVVCSIWCIACGVEEARTVRLDLEFIEHLLMHLQSLEAHACIRCHHTCMCVRTFIGTFTCMDVHVCMYACVIVYIYISMSVYTYVDGEVPVPCRIATVILQSKLQCVLSHT